MWRPEESRPLDNGSSIYAWSPTVNPQLVSVLTAGTGVESWAARVVLELGRELDPASAQDRAALSRQANGFYEAAEQPIGVADDLTAMADDASRAWVDRISRCPRERDEAELDL